jgi:hypothetical protein
MRINGEPKLRQGAVRGGPPQPTLMNTVQFGAGFRPRPWRPGHHTTNMLITSQHVSIVERLTSTNTIAPFG